MQDRKHRRLSALLPGLAVAVALAGTLLPAPAQGQEADVAALIAEFKGCADGGLGLRWAIGNALSVVADCADAAGEDRACLRYRGRRRGGGEAF